MINVFKSLSIQGSSMGQLNYIGPDRVGKEGNVKVAMFNVADSLETTRIAPQSGFSYPDHKLGEEMRFINGRIVAGEARTNSRAGARVATFAGTIVPKSSNEQDRYSADEYDAVFVTGKNQHVVGRVRSADAFNRNSLILFGIAENYKTDNRNAIDRDETTDKPILSNYQLNLVPKAKANGELTEDDYIRILISPDEHDRIIGDLKRGQEIYPQGLKFAFVGNSTTDWTVYADQIDLAPNNPTASTPTPKADNKPAGEAKDDNTKKSN